MSGQLHVPAVLPPVKELMIDYPLDRGVVWPQSISGRSSKKGKNPVGTVNRTSVIHIIASRFTDSGTQAHPLL